VVSRHENSFSHQVRIIAALRGLQHGSRTEPDGEARWAHARYSPLRCQVTPYQL
jgi:hypothetical protein